MKRAKLIRVLDNGVQTQGVLTFDFNGKEIRYYTLELAWKNNAKSISCIPKGTYHVKTTYSNKYKRDMWEIMSVKGRDGIRIHSGNFYFDIEGCILVGKGLSDINGDGYKDVVGSRDAIKEIEGMIGREFIIDIV